jgi:tetratricopeptide (TPR) repeat protein
MDAAYSQLARLYILQENDYNAAAEISREGLRIVKNDTVKYALLKNLGWARLGQGRYREAKENLENAIALDSNRAAAYCLFAQVLEAENDLKKAQNQWKRCQQYVDQENPDEDVWLGIARKRLTAGGEES